MVAVRATASGLAAAEYEIVPLKPVPTPPASIVSHDALEVADQLHHAPLVDTATLPTPPDGGIEAELADNDG